MTAVVPGIQQEPSSDTVGLTPQICIGNHDEPCFLRLLRYLAPALEGMEWSQSRVGLTRLRLRRPAANGRAPFPSSAAAAPLGEGTSRPSQVDPRPPLDLPLPASQRVPGVEAVLHV